MSWQRFWPSLSEAVLRVFCSVDLALSISVTVYQSTLPVHHYNHPTSTRHNQHATTSTGAGFEKNTLISGHLYQLFSYMAHCKPLNPTKKIEGVLIYPLYDNYVNSSAITPSGSLRVITVDFKQEWNEISRDLLAIALAKS